MRLIIFLGLLVLGYLAGTAAEKKHYNSIVTREEELSDLPILTVSKLSDTMMAHEAKLVSGSVVISIDYFKRILAQLINIVGGKVISYESLVDRARREAILRLKEDAKGSDYIINIRIETSAIGNAANSKSSVGSVEVLAYGTAIKVDRHEIGL